jgi:SNF2 family DNA or RNA helicase
LKILEQIREKDGETREKTIVFSQFTTMLDMIEPFLKDAGVKYVRCAYHLLIWPVLRD